MFGERLFVLVGLKQSEVKKAEATVTKAYNGQTVEKFVEDQRRLEDMLDNSIDTTPFRLPNKYKF